MKKRILVGLVMGAVAMGSAYATLRVAGDNEMLEGAEGHIRVHFATDEGETVVTPTKVEHVSGVPVQISVDPASPLIPIIVPGEVSTDSESTVRITVGNETIDHTFKVVNQAEPEQVSGKTIAQCTFYNDYRGHTGLAGTGGFSFDKRTVLNVIEGAGKEYPGDNSRVISTTRGIENSFDSGLMAFEENGSIRILPPSFMDGGNPKEGWYAGPGHFPGQIFHARRGPRLYINDGFWTSEDQVFGGYFPEDYATFQFTGRGNYTNDSSARGEWSATLEISPEGQGGGYFTCKLSEEGSLPACGGTFDLPNNQWQQISLPCQPVSRPAVSEVFANIPGTYGSDWAVYKYYTANNPSEYIKLDLDDRLKRGEGYWIIQKSGNTVTLAMPQGSVPTATIPPAGCDSVSGCVEIPLVTNWNGDNQWSMVGFPFESPLSLNATRVRANLNDCNSKTGCTLETAMNLGIVHNQLWNYVDAETGYAQVKNNDTLKPWQGYWSVSLPNAGAAKPVKLVIPKP